MGRSNVIAFPGDWDDEDDYAADQIEDSSTPEDYEIGVRDFDADDYDEAELDDESPADGVDDGVDAPTLGPGPIDEPVDQEDRGGSGRGDRARVVEGTVVARLGETSGTVPVPFARAREERLPIVPGWMSDPGTRQSATRNALVVVAHRTGFHLARMPYYTLRHMGWTPRGAGRALNTWWHWVWDLESRSLRLAARDAGEKSAYIALKRIRNEHAKNRWIGTGTALLPTTVFTAGTALSWWSLPGGTVPAIVGTGVLVLGFVGRRKDAPFLAQPAITAPGRKLTPDLLVQAFAAVRLCTLDEPITFASMIAAEGDGVGCLIDLPYGRKASTAIARREDIASGLDIDETRLFLERVRGDAGSARRVSVWVANSDPYARKSRLSPLIGMESFDFWKPFPFGTDARGRLVVFCLLWTNFLVGAIPRQGKTFAARLPAAAAALDAYVQLFVFDGKGGTNLEAFELVAHRFGCGIRKVVVEHLLHTLEEMVDDVDDRYERLKTLPRDARPEGKVTPAITRSKKLKMPLRVLLIDEVHRYLEDEQHGKRILELLIELVKVAPAMGVMVILATQRPDGKVIPENLRGQMGTRFALKVMNWQASETILGAGTYNSGLDASKLLKAHKGVGILLGADDSGATDGEAVTVRTDMLDDPDLFEICERGRQLRIDAGVLTGHAAGDTLNEAGAPKLLEDILAVFEPGEDALWSETITARLAKRDAASYDGWNPRQLSAVLGARPYGLSTQQMWGETNAGEKKNRRGFTREQIHDALAAQVDRAAGRSGDDGEAV